MHRIERKNLLAKFHEMIAKRQPIIGGGAGRAYRQNARKLAALI